MVETSAILILTFDDVNKGDQALKTLKEWQKEDRIVLGDAVVLVKDEKGKVKVHETEDFTTKRGAIAGGIAGLVVGTIVGGPVGGLVLGAAAGGLVGKKIDLGISDDEIKAVSDSMEDASSAICVQIKSIEDKAMLAAAIRQSGGKVHELSLTEDLEVDMEETILRGGIR
jgi:uncharacterized membrane protein